MKKYEVEGHAESYLPDGKEWKLIWHDEFDGTELDTSKWSFRTNYWGRKSNTYTTEGVELDGNSNLKLHLLEKDGQYFSPYLQTGANSFDQLILQNESMQNPWEGEAGIWPLRKLEQPKFMHRYGYYEIRCKFQKQPGWWSAFWLQSPSIGTTVDAVYSGVEVDIMECFKRNGEVTSGNIYGGYGDDYKSDARIYYQIKESKDEYHYFGVDWSEDGYIFYCDGKETARSKGPVSKVEQFILVSTECMGYRKGDLKTPSSELTQAKLPDCFTVDFVRVYDEMEK